jgi:hypothetical protein
MKKPILLLGLTILLTNISLNAFAFNTDNQTNYEIHLHDGNNLGINGYYHEIVPAHQTSKGWSTNEEQYICAEYVNEHLPRGWGCCLVRAHKKQIITGDSKNRPKANCN